VVMHPLDPTASDQGDSVSGLDDGLGDRGVHRVLDFSLIRRANRREAGWVH
jgi:hypothetical protein